MTGPVVGRMTSRISELVIDYADPEGNEFRLLRLRLDSVQVAGHA